MKYLCETMKENRYIRIHKDVESYAERYHEIITVWDHYEFYFSSIANCARWLDVSYNAVRLCLRGEYTLCKGFAMQYVDEAPDERDYFIDPDKYRNPDLKFESGDKYVDSAGKQSHRKTIER